MTNADWLNSRPELTAAAVIARAEEWYRETRPAADTAAAGLLVMLTEWLAAEHDDSEARRTVTVVTTLTVTHILHELDADQVTGQVAQRLAESALQSARYGNSCLHEVAQADNISISTSGVQVFGLENDDPSGIVDDGTDTEARA